MSDKPISFSEWKKKRGQTDTVKYIFTESKVYAELKKTRVIDWLNASFIPGDVKGVLNEWIDNGSRQFVLDNMLENNREGYIEKIQEIAQLAEMVMPHLIIRPVELKEPENIRMLTMMDRVRFIQDVCGFEEVPSAEFPEPEDRPAETEGPDIQDPPDEQGVQLSTDVLDL